MAFKYSVWLDAAEHIEGTADRDYAAQLMQERIREHLEWFMSAMLDEFPSLRCDETADTCEHDGCTHDITGSDLLDFVEEQLREMPELKRLQLKLLKEVT